MSRGLPVITTSNTAGPDIIERRRNGFIIPIRSPEAITVELDRLATDSGKLREMKRAAFEAAKSFAWQSYRNNLIRTLRAIRASSGAVLAGIDWKVLVLKKLQQVWTQLREQSLIPAEFAD